MQRRSDRAAFLTKETSIRKPTVRTTRCGSGSEHGAGHAEPTNRRGDPSCVFPVRKPGGDARKREITGSWLPPCWPRNNLARMAWVKVRREPSVSRALPDDARVETQKMFGGVAAKVNGNIFAGLFGQSTMLWLPKGARCCSSARRRRPFDPWVMVERGAKESCCPKHDENPPELRRWMAARLQGRRSVTPKAAKTKGKAKPKK